VSIWFCGTVPVGSFWLPSCAYSASWIAFAVFAPIDSSRQPPVGPNIGAGRGGCARITSNVGVAPGLVSGGDASALGDSRSTDPCSVIAGAVRSMSNWLGTPSSGVSTSGIGARRRVIVSW
jgi:hypothetical protein